MNQYFVYIMASNTGNTIYVGFTRELKRRVLQHKSKEIDGFSKKYNCVNLVYFEELSDESIALKREKQLKKWRRTWKNELIEKSNPEWEDLAGDWD